ncbi:hypothetical protein [Paraburkholderia ferrariae]|uniref:hypothetical protein n=1 Tax=Paraburkholderia ferrariae TaxID=386056 RepID=UPI00048986BB|nr:hypothetical protein [Paraburkholderia ferrariae]
MQIALSDDAVGVVRAGHAIDVRANVALDGRALPGRGGTAAPASPGSEFAGLEASLRKLGHLTVFAFASGEFMLIGRDGERVRDCSFVGALQKMLQWQGCEAVSPQDMNCAT